MCCLRHAEHPARNRTSLAGLEQNLLFFGPPYIKTNLDTEHNIKHEFRAIIWLVGLYVRWNSNSTWFYFASYIRNWGNQNIYSLPWVYETFRSRATSSAAFSFRVPLMRLIWNQESGRRHNQGHGQHNLCPTLSYWPKIRSGKRHHQGDGHYHLFLTKYNWPKVWAEISSSRPWYCNITLLVRALADHIK